MKESDNFNNVLALIMVLGFFTVVFIMLFHEIPDGSKDMLGPIIGGVIGSAVTMILQYKWGSSAGSAAKSDTIAALTGTGDGSGITTTKSKTIKEEVTTKEVTSSAVLPWAPGTAYSAGDLVTIGTQKYRALVNHGASTADEPGTGANWAGVWEKQA